MKTKDRVVQATDRIAEALTILVRINYDNDKQAADNAAAAIKALRVAVTQLEQTL